MLLLHVRFDKSCLSMVKNYTLQECILTKTIQTQNKSFNFNDFNGMYFYLHKNKNIYNQSEKAIKCCNK